MIDSNTPSRYFHATVLVALAVKLWLVGAHHVVAAYAPHDDVLFISQANSILSGEWLGVLNQLTLIKGPFYPLFMVLSYYLSVPLLLAQQLLATAASYLLIRAVYPLVQRKWLLAVLFIFLLFNPFSYNYPAVGRILRLGIYPSLGLLSFSCIAGLWIRLRLESKTAALWAVGAGIVLFGFWNTREESIWIVPSLLLMIAGALWQIRQRHDGRLLALVLLALPGVLLFAGNSWLKTVNERHYGIPATIELETPEFKSAYGGLLRIKSDKWQQYYPVVQDVRQKGYAVSPALKEIEPYLEGEVGRKWQELCGCPDIPAAFFIWAFRDSVAAAGYYDDGPRTLDYYRRIGDEIDAACDAGTLDCRPRITSLVPTWHREYNHLFLPTYFDIVHRIVSFRDFSASSSKVMSKGSTETMLIYQTVTRDQLQPSRRDLIDMTPAYHARLDREKERVLGDIGKLYMAVVTPLFVLSLIVFLWRAGRGLKRRSLSIYTVVGGAALAGVLSLAFILTLLFITSYSEIERAMHSAYPMTLVFICAMALELFSGSSPNRSSDQPQWRDQP